MNRSRTTSRITLPASIAIALIAVLALVAGGVLGAVDPARPSASLPVPSGKPATPAPSSLDPGDPTARPTAEPTPAGPIVTPAPSGPPDDASDGVDRVDLANWPGVRSTVIVWDESDSLADAHSGTPGRGSSLGYDEIEVVALDDDTLRLTWSELPIENEVRISIRLTTDGTFVIRVVRPLPQEPTDGVVTDRVLILDFHVAVPAADVDVELIDSLQNDG